MNTDKITRLLIEALSKTIIAAMPKKYFTTSEKANKYMLEGDKTFTQKAGDFFTCGFAKEDFTPSDAADNKYFIAGYDSNNRAQKVLDNLFARAIYVDDNTGRGGVILCVIDAVGISRKDINDIRRLVIESNKIPNIKSISISATHTHAGIDTQGLWGEKFYKTGRNDAFMEELKKKAAAAIISAYENRKDGKLFYSFLKTEDMLYDHREPTAYDPNLTKIRFEAFDGSEEIHLINFACHAELLGSKTKQISADFPCYMIREIEKNNKNTNALFFNGAIGGMISAKEIRKVYRESIDCEAYTKQYGKALGELANSMKEETELEPVINVRSVPLKILGANFVLIIARLLNVLNNDILRSGKRSQAYVASELGYMELGKNQVGIFLIPGELFPELWDGNFFPAELSATGKNAEYHILRDMSSCDHRFIIGLCNDELGYIVPDNDFIVNEKIPYIEAATDIHGRRHYEETNSTGPETARTILDTTEALIKSVK